MKDMYGKSKMKGYGKVKTKEYGGKQNVHQDKTGYKKLDHDRSTERCEDMSYDSLQKMVKKL